MVFQSKLLQFNNWKKKMIGNHKMPFKSIIRELREMADGIRNKSRQGVERKHWRSRTRSHIAPDLTPSEPIEQGQWANLPSELLLDIIRRVEESETSWPSRTVVVSCASVCKSWRDATKETVKTLEECGKLTFPISLKQPGPRDSPIQCFIKRDRATSVYSLYFGLIPSEEGNDKLLLAAKKIRRATCTDFVISLVADDFSRASNIFGKLRQVFAATISAIISLYDYPSHDDFVISLVADDFSQASNIYVGKLRQVFAAKLSAIISLYNHPSHDPNIYKFLTRSNFLGTKFTIYDSQPTNDAAIQQNSRQGRRFHVKQVSPSVTSCNYSVATISYELNVLRTRGPRRMYCVMNSVPLSSIQEGGTAPTPTSFTHSSNEKFSLSPLASKGKKPLINFSSLSLKADQVTVPISGEPLILKNKDPRWHEQLQCWCLNFKGRVTVASVKNFQLAAYVDPSQNVSTAEQETVILQFGKIGRDIFTMDYCYPLSAFQAFAICLSSFDTKPTCE